jgi:hypothetical protein
MNRIAFSSPSFVSTLPNTGIRTLLFAGSRLEGPSVCAYFSVTAGSNTPGRTQRRVGRPPHLLMYFLSARDPSTALLALVPTYPFSKGQPRPSTSNAPQSPGTIAPRQRIFSHRFRYTLQTGSHLSDGKPARYLSVKSHITLQYPYPLACRPPLPHLSQSM